VNVRVEDDPAGVVAQMLREAAGGQVVLTGGSSPQRAYELAADADWSGTTVWFSDERRVPFDDERSNWLMAEQALFARTEHRPDVHRMEDAASYEKDLRGHLGETPRFDFVLLGLGPDSHVASLFPGKPEVDVTDRWVVDVPEAGLEPFVPRTSLTMPLLNAGAHVVFLITGENKVDAVRRAFAEDDPSAPGAHVRPDSGELTLVLDAAAAKGLDR
jgi:6-phosphogluconolactonase